MKHILNLALLTLFLTGCTSPTPSNTQKKDTPTTNIEKKFFHTKSTIFLRTSPSDSSNYVIDKINSSDIHKEYCSVDSSRIMVVVAIQDEWSRVQVVEPEWLSKSHIGWMPSNKLTEYVYSKEALASPLKISEQYTELETPKVLTPTDELKERINDGIKNINGIDAISKIDLTTLENINIALAVFKVYYRLIRDGEASNDKDVRVVATHLKAKAIANQVRYFPKIRKAYFELTKDRLWEHDIYVTTGGNGNTVLKFTGGYFAANANIKSTQEALKEMLTTLRFRQTQYRWYKGQDEFTYYVIKSGKDTVLDE